MVMLTFVGEIKFYNIALCMHVRVHARVDVVECIVIL